jgi:D-amino peptidase
MQRGRRPGLSCFVSADMEGLAGTVSWNEYERDLPRLRQQFTREVKAVCDGLLGSGVPVQRVLVCDAHGSGENLLIEELPDRVLVSRGSGRPLMMMHGLDAGFDMVLLVGYHAGAGTARALMDHTYSSRSFYRVLINGREMDEAMINAALAGHLGVPVGLVSGDRELVRRARREFPGAETVVTKFGASRFGAIVRAPAAVCRELAAAAARAARRVREMRAYRIGPGPVRVELQLATTGHADLVGLIPGVRRIDGRTIRYRSPNMLEAYRMLRLAAILAVSASAYL